MRKLINVANRARPVECRSTLRFVWCTALANLPRKYSNPEVRYPIYNSNNSNILIITINFKIRIILRF